MNRLADAGDRVQAPSRPRFIVVIGTSAVLLSCTSSSGVPQAGGAAGAPTNGAQAVEASSAGRAGESAAGPNRVAAGSGGLSTGVAASAGRAADAVAGSGAGANPHVEAGSSSAEAGRVAGASGSGAAGASAPGTVPSSSGKSTENDLGDCAVAMLPAAGALPAIAKLPDPFEKLDGTRVSMKSDWHCRQAEIRKQAETYVYGTKPPKPEHVSGSVTKTNISVDVMDGDKSTTFSATVVLPSSGTPPYPAIIVYGGLGLGFGIPLDTTVINDEGIALINYDVGVTGKEGTPRNSKQGAFYDIAGSTSSAGLMVAWGWGTSRFIDVVEQSDGTLLKADAIAVTGCSRFGKGAFAAGAFDQRIALTLPIESGTGGTPTWRAVSGEDGAQTLDSAYSEQPWFGDAFNAFTSDATKAPIDTHELIGLIAPRGLLILDNPTIAHLAPKSGYVAALAGAEIYKALGAGDNLTYHSAIQNGSHCSMRPEWSAPFKNNVRRFLTKTGSEPGAIDAASSVTSDVSKWIDWTTPPLN